MASFQSYLVNILLKFINYNQCHDNFLGYTLLRQFRHCPLQTL